MTSPTHLQFALLTALARGPLHGYALIDEAEGTLGRRPGVATIYAALDKLTVLGWIAHAKDEVVDGRLRRYFVLSESGSTVLAAEANEMARRAERAMKALRSAAMGSTA
jgi:DNA-binding PadR family transcriptional regulator